MENRKRKSCGNPLKTKFKQGSIFLIALGVITIMFILGFSLTYFTGSEDWASAISYESEIAFNLAESAVEEFVARLKYSLNHDDANNQLYKVLRDVDESRLGKEIPLDAVQITNLTRYTRETAREIYGIQFDRDLVTSRDFGVEAGITLKPIEEVKQENYIIRKDKKEKQGELSVTVKVSFKGRQAKVSLVFLVRVVKIFVPPFNYFTLYVKNGTPFGRTGGAAGGSNFNAWKSENGNQDKNLSLDNGWRQIPGQENFDAVQHWQYWEKELANLGNDSPVPPGRVYLGQSPSDMNPQVPSIFIQSTNGTKFLRDNPTDRQINYSIVAQENLFLKPDVPWMGMKTFVTDVMKLQTSDEGVKKGIIFSPWSNDNKIRILNIGAGHEIFQDWFQDVPAFNNALGSYKMILNNRKQNPSGGLPPEVVNRLYPEVNKSGLDLFGYARPLSIDPGEKAAIDTSTLSPTLVYGPVGKMYFRIVSLGDKDTTVSGGGTRLELPFVGTQKGPGDTMAPVPIMPNLIGKKLTASEAKELFRLSGVKSTGTENYLEKFISNWDKLIPDPLKEVKKENGEAAFQYEKFMSNVGVELYNEGLGNILQRIKNKDNDKLEAYDGLLKKHLMGFLTNQEIANTPGDLQNIARKSPVQEFFLGDLFYAMPDETSTYLMDFYFIPRSTEDFFRGRTTVSVGGVSQDRFLAKYINTTDPSKPTLELNGILALNDPADLKLQNLLFRGRGVIYSSPMMGGGKVVVLGDFKPASGNSGTTPAMGANSLEDPDMVTIVAPQIEIDTDSSPSDPCYVEANLISVNEPLIVRGQKKIIIKGSVACPYMDLEKSFPNTDGGGIIRYNALNTNWRKNKPQMMNSMYVGKIVTGGVGKFEWKYDSEQTN